MPQTMQVKSTESFLLPQVQGPGFAAIQEHAPHACLVELGFCVLCQLAILPDSLCQSVKCCSSLSDVPVKFSFDGETVQDYVAKIYEFMDSSQLMVNDIDRGWFIHSLSNHLHFAKANGASKIFESCSKMTHELL